METTPYSVIRVEVQPTNPVKPCNFGVFKNGEIRAYLEYEEVKRALSEYELLLAAYEAR